MGMNTKTLCDILQLKEGEEGRGLEFINQQRRTFVDDSLSKLNIDAIYYIKSLETRIPVIYFKELRTYDEDSVMELHRRVWSEGKTPFLIVILPNAIRVYNTFVPPPTERADFNKALIKALDLFTEANKKVRQIREEFSEFSREKIDTGDFWKNRGLRFENAKRVDVYLLDNLKIVRDWLVKSGLSFSIINT